MIPEEAVLKAASFSLCINAALVGFGRCLSHPPLIAAPGTVAHQRCGVGADTDYAVVLLMLVDMVVVGDDVMLSAIGRLSAP